MRIFHLPVRASNTLHASGSCQGNGRSAPLSAAHSCIAYDFFNTGTSMARALFLSIAALFLVAGCENADSLRIEETRSKLVGTWLREDGTDGEKSPRLLYLGADGKFVDSISMSNSEGRIERTELSGEWSYDGKSLKRRFLQDNGRQFSGGRMRYATFTLVSAETSEFVVNDNIVGREVRYRRTFERAQK